MSKQFPIPTRPGRFKPHGPTGPDIPAPMIVRDGEGVVMGSEGANPLVLSRPDGDCCCADEIPGCESCEHFDNDLFESAYFDCDRLVWRFTEEFDCDTPNDQTLCCRTFLPTPFAHVQLQTAIGDFYFPNSCFSMRVFMNSFNPQSVLALTCCIGVAGIIFDVGQGLAATMFVRIEAVGLYSGDFSIFGNIPCNRIIDNSSGRGTALDGGYTVSTNITLWRNVTRIRTNLPLTCGKIGPFGRGCEVHPNDGEVIKERSEFAAPLDGLGFDPPFAWRWKQFFDSRDYLDSSLNTQFQIEPEAAIGIGAEHSVEPC